MINDNPEIYSVQIKFNVWIVSIKKRERKRENKTLRDADEIWIEDKVESPRRKTGIRTFWNRERKRNGKGREEEIEMEETEGGEKEGER